MSAKRDIGIYTALLALGVVVFLFTRWRGCGAEGPTVHEARGEYYQDNPNDDDRRAVMRVLGESCFAGAAGRNACDCLAAGALASLHVAGDRQSPCGLPSQARLHYYVRALHLLRQQELNDVVIRWAFRSCQLDQPFIWPFSENACMCHPTPLACLEFRVSDDMLSPRQPASRR